MVLRAPWDQSMRSVVTTAHDEMRPVAASRRQVPPPFDAVYREHLDQIHGYCYRRLGSTHAAEDATQQVFTQAFAKRHTLRGESPQGWLFAIARNVTASAIRSWQPSISLEMAADLADEDRSPEEAMIDVEQSSLVRAAMRQLTAEQREVIELRFSGVSIAECARILRSSEGAVKQLQHRAVLRLRTAFGLDPQGKEHADA